MASVESEIKRLRAEVDRLEARLEDERHEPERDAVEPSVVTPDPRPGRRQLLTKVASGAAAAVVGGAALAVGQASPAAAAAGVFDGNPAVTADGDATATGVGVSATGGSASGGIGVSGTGGIGVLGEGQFSWGVRGIGVSGVSGNSNGAAGTWGVQGISPNGIGTAGESTSNVGLSSLVGAQGMHLRLGGSPIPPLTSAKTWQRGDMQRDTNGDLWLCINGGTPGTWRRVSGPNTAGSLTTLAAPVRVYDSRPGLLPAVTPKNPLGANNPRTLDLKENSSGVPAGATAALVNLVATGTTTAVGGFMAIYRNGISFPGTSNLNWSGPNQTVAVTTLTALDAQARVNVYAGSITDVVLDVLGYYL